MVTAVVAPPRRLVVHQDVEASVLAADAIQQCGDGAVVADVTRHADSRAAGRVDAGRDLRGIATATR